MTKFRARLRPQLPSKPIPLGSYIGNPFLRGDNVVQTFTIDGRPTVGVQQRSLNPPHYGEEFVSMANLVEASVNTEMAETLLALISPDPLVVDAEAASLLKGFLK